MPLLPDNPSMAKHPAAKEAAEVAFAKLRGKKPTDESTPVEAKVNGKEQSGFVEVPANGGKSKRKRKAKTIEDRGPTGLPKYRGTGFEGL